MMKDFFKFNIGHVGIIIVWLVTVVWGYSDLNTRVKSLEVNIVNRGIAIETLRAQGVIEAREQASQLSILNARLSTMGNDIDWIKKNIK